MGKKRRSKAAEAAAQGIAQPLKAYNKILQRAAFQASNEASQKGDALHNTGGVINQGINTDEKNEAFAFPYKFAETAEQMARDPFLHKALRSRQSKLEMSKWWFGYQSPELAESPQHSFVIDYLNEQIENCGGIARFISKQVLPSMKYGVSLFAPTFEIEERLFSSELLSLTRFKNIFWYHPGFMFRIFMDAEDLSRVGSVQYWLPDKATISLDISKNAKKTIKTEVSRKLTPTELKGLDKGEDVVRNISMGGQLTLTNIDLKMRMGGVVSYNTEGSNPIGRPYTYPLYGIHLTTEAILNSAARLYYGPGVHSYQAVPINSDAAFLGDSSGAIDQVELQWQKMQEQGGGAFISNTHKIEPISANEVKDVPTILETLFQLSSRTLGESIETLGMDGSGSRPQSTAMLRIQQPELVLDANQICFDVSNTFIKNFVDMNFGHWIKSGYLQEYPVLKWDIGEVEEVLNNTEKKDVSLTSPVRVAASEIINNTNNAGNATESVIDKGIVQKKRYIKRDPNTAIETITIDVEAMERAYAKAEDNIRATIDKIIKQKVVPILEEGGDLKTIKKEVERLTKDIRLALEGQLNEDIKDFVDLSLQGYLRTANKMEIELNLDKMAEKALKDAQASIKEKASIAAAGLTNEIINDISRFFNRNIALSNREIANLAINVFSADSQYNYVNFAKDVVMYNAGIADQELASNLANEGYQVAVVRTAILEGSCEHCKDFDGIIYYMNNNGEYWNPEGLPHYPLPDSNCAGMVHGKGTCRCKEIPVYTGLLRFFNGVPQ